LAKFAEVSRVEPNSVWLAGAGEGTMLWFLVLLDVENVHAALVT
jgi:hypothetical protein